MNDPRSVFELLNAHVAIMKELRSRGVLRSANNPTGDLAEWLFCKAFGWEQASNSVKGYDATDSDGLRYQIKGRRVHRRNPSRQLSAIRASGDCSTRARWRKHQLGSGRGWMKV